MTATPPEPVRLLLVEDNPIEARATLKGLENLTTRYEVEVVEDGDAAINYLTSVGRHPDLVLLDLNLPGRDGLDVLERVKSDPALRRIPIVVLTTSSNDLDVSRSYDRGANAYVNKPSDLDAWRDAMETIEAFWLTLARLPPS